MTCPWSGKWSKSSPTGLDNNQRPKVGDTVGYEMNDGVDQIAKLCALDAVLDAECTEAVIGSSRIKSQPLTAVALALQCGKWPDVVGVTRVGGPVLLARSGMARHRFAFSVGLAGWQCQRCRRFARTTGVASKLATTRRCLRALLPGAAYVAGHHVRISES